MQLPSGLFGANAACRAVMIPAHNLNTAMQRRAAGKESATGRMKAVCLRLIGLPASILSARRTIRALACGPGG